MLGCHLPLDVGMSNREEPANVAGVVGLDGADDRRAIRTDVSLVCQAVGVTR
jgi:hypothetical protein